MEKETIKENNTLIAEFMGGHVVDEIFICNESTKSHNERCLHHYNISQAKYHSSWDWLMSIVEKIEEQCKAHITMFAKTCYIEYYGVHNDPPKFEYKGTDLKESVYICCVEFIKWYNKQCK